jgi:anti-anti-sigma factor
VSARLADGEVFDSAKLKNTVRFLIENDMRNVVIDLGNLEYLYSDTINAFIASNRHMLEVSGRIAILTEHPKVQDILKRAGLDNIMRIYRSEAEMIADSKEILRQTSSYRIEELQKISTQPQDHPQIPRTEFDDFKAEMGQRLGSKLDNNELPQYQLGVPQNPVATPGNFGQGPRTQEPAYPTFNAPSFSPPQVPEAPPQTFPHSQNAPAYNPYNKQALGLNNAAPNYPTQPPQNFNQAPPPNFDFPTVQLPVGQFGGGTPMQPPLASPPMGASKDYPPNDDDLIDDDQEDPRQRKSAQERMRSPSARRQQGRRVGGRELPGQEEDPQTQERSGYSEDRDPEPPNRDNEKYAPYNMPPSRPTSLVEEKGFPTKLVLFVLLIAAAIGGFFYYSSTNTPTEKSPLTAPTPEPAPVGVEPSTVVAPAPDTAMSVVPPSAVVAPPAPTAVTPLIPNEGKPGAPATAVGPPPLNPAKEPTPSQPVSVKPKATVAVTPPAPVLKPLIAPKQPKPIAQKKPPRAEKVEKPVYEPKNTEEPEKAVISKGLRITSEPSGAEVLVNFSKKGTTPVEIALTNNSNKIIVRMPGYKRFETTLPKNHPDHELEVNLEQEEGQEPPQPKTVSKPMPKPEVKVEPKPEPKQEPKLVDEPAPKVEEYREPEDLPIAKAKPEKVEKYVPPTPSRPEPEAPPGDGPIGIIFLSSSPARADIFIDGKNTGKKTPAKLELPSGNHKIEMSKSGQKSSVNQVVNEGKNKAVHLTLQ